VAHQPQGLDIRSWWSSVMSVAKSMYRRHVNERRNQIEIAEDDDEGAH
jgi:hypothetical protein